jgi:cytochrome c oxidase subunit 4
MGHHATPAGEIAKPNTKWIWKVFWILLVVTTVEVTLAYIWPESLSIMLLNVIFITLTLVKAFYIVAEFMHLGHEVKSLVLSITLPLIFLIWFVVAMMVDGTFWLECRQFFIQ